MTAFFVRRGDTLSFVFGKILLISNHSRTIVTVGGGSHLHNTIRTSLTGDGYFVRHAPDLSRACSFIREMNPRVVVVDSALKPFEMEDIITSTQKLKEKADVIVVGVDDQFYKTAESLGLQFYLARPVAPETLISTIKSLLKWLPFYKRFS